MLQCCFDHVCISVAMIFYRKQIINSPKINKSKTERYIKNCFEKEIEYENAVFSLSLLLNITH